MLKYQFPAVKGCQAGKDYYICMVPLGLMSKIFATDSSDVPAEYRAQRKLNEARIPEICGYILSNRDSYVFSALAASVDGDMKFVPADSNENAGLKFIQFDVYYCCALIGMAAGQIDEDTSELKDLVERYPVQYRDCKAQIAGLLVASEARRLGIDTQSPKLEQIMLQYISNNDTLLSEDGIKTLNAYALKGYRLITDYPLFDKPTSREEFLDAFNVAMQFYEKKDS